MKSKFGSMWRVVIALMLVLSLALVFAPAQQAVADEPPTGCCVVTAPDFAIALGCPVDDQLFIDNGASCSAGCEMTLDYSSVDSSAADEYDYTVTCTDGTCSISDTGTVTVEDRIFVNIIECPGCTTCDEDSWEVPVSTNFGIKAEIWNMNCIPQDVTAEIVVDDVGAELVLPSTATIALGTMPVFNPGLGVEKVTVAWTVHCKAEGNTTITVNTNHSNSPNSDPRTWDSCTVHQIEAPSLVVVVKGPCEVCTNCDYDEFEIDAWVTNNGDIDVDDVFLDISKTGGSGSADIKDALHVWIGTVPANTTVKLSDNPGGAHPWNVECTGEGDVVFQVDATGTHHCTGDPVVGTPGTWTVQQEDVLVDVTCVIGLEAGWEAQSDWNNFDGNPATDLDMSAAWACTDTCPQESDVLSGDADLGQYVAITANVHNCTQQPKNITVELTKPSMTVLGDAFAHIYCSSASVDTFVAVVDGGTTWDVDMDGLCGCCDVDVTYILQCTGASTQEDVAVEVVERSPGSGGPWDNSNCDTAKITQVDKAHLETDMTAYVADCDCTPMHDTCTGVDTVGVGQAFDVKIEVTNTGDADAYDVTGVINVTGGTDCLLFHGPADFGTVHGGSGTEYVWLSDILTEPLDYCTCLDETLVMVTIEDMSGFDENTCEPIPEANIGSQCPLYLNQCDIELELINPETCENILNGQYFAVKAQVSNCGTCDFEDIDFTLYWDGCDSVSLHPDYSALKTQTLEEILHNPCGTCDEECAPYIYEVTWMVKCECPGDVSFWVCAESEDSDSTPEWVGPHIRLKSNKETIHQIVPAELGIEIISPDTGNKYATSEEYAVTAVVTNTGFATANEVTASISGNGFDVVINNQMDPDPVVTLGSMEPGEQEMITWTVHCNETGLTNINVSADAINLASEPDCNLIDSVIVWQYPAAHLVVNITESPPEPVVTCSSYNVTARITNTGAADASEVYATLSVNPDGSVRVSADDPDGTYTKYVGTIPGHGSPTNYRDVTWNLHCKVACESEITVTATGNDEYGWHIKQHNGTTGNFVIEEGGLISEQLEWYSGDSADPPRGWSYGLFVGDANSLPPGPYIVDTDLSMAAIGGGPDFLGHLSGTGFVIPNVSDGDLFFMNYVYPPGYNPPFDLDFTDLFDTCSIDDVLGRDIMFWVVHITMDSSYDMIGPWSEWCVENGLIEVINGTIGGSWTKWNEGFGYWQDSLLAGTFCSNMAAQAGLPIQEGFIEPDGVTVKQLPANADLVITKDSDVTEPQYIGSDVTFTITVTNNGPSDATSIWVKDVIPAGLDFKSWSAPQGWYYVGSGDWSVGNLANGQSAALEIVATVNTVGEICNTASVSFADQHDPITGNNADVVCVTGKALDPVTHAVVELDAGFNLISLPLIPDNPDIQAMMAGIDFLVVARYDTTPPSFPVYAGGVPTPPFTTMNDGVGYWVNMNTAGPPNLEFNGDELVADPLTPPPSYDVVEGWNLIGFKSTVPKLPEDYLAAIAGKYVMIYGYDGNFFIAGAPGHEMLQPGLGYWLAVKTGEAGTIFP